MGSRPWISMLRDRLSPDHEGERFVVLTPKGQTVEGMFVGTGDISHRPHLVISTAPEGMGVRHPDYFDHEVWVKIERGVTINGIPADDFGYHPPVIDDPSTR